MAASLESLSIRHQTAEQLNESNEYRKLYRLQSVTRLAMTQRPKHFKPHQNYDKEKTLRALDY